MEITDTPGKPKGLLSIDRARLAAALGPSLGHGCSTTPVAHEEKPLPLTLKCGCCGTKHPENTQRCDSCGCSERLGPIKECPATPITDLLPELRTRSRIMAVWRRLRFPDVYPFSGDTKSPRPL